jgi:putative phosphoribosyl transferase
MPFADRRDAGRRLGAELVTRNYPDPLVLGLPRGGVPVAVEVARALDAPLDVLVIRKLGCPRQPELGIGAIGEGGVRVLNRRLIDQVGVSDAELERIAGREQVELERRLDRYRQGRPAVPLEGRTVVLIDDGLATGFTARAAVEVSRRRGAARVVLAVPVAPTEAVTELASVADEVVCLETPRWFGAIGAFYADFSQTSDEEVTRLLIDAAASIARSGAAEWERDDPQPRGANGDAVREVDIAIARRITLPGELREPPSTAGIVVFAHGSGSGRHSPRNRVVAEALGNLGLATLLFDLLTPREAADRRNVFDIELLGQRLVAVTRWLRAQPPYATRPVGYFGASTGAAAALWAAAEQGGEVAAVVSRGGRPDLAAGRLRLVTAPTLLIVGSRDVEVLELNRAAQRDLRCENRLEIVAGATHLFEEPGALEEVADIAGRWLAQHLQGLPAPS